MISSESLSWIAFFLILTPAMIWCFGILLWRQPGTRSFTEELPPVSVIIAGRNEEDYIEACLNSVMKSDYPVDRLEVLFVDDHSTDRTLKVASSLSDGTPFKLSVLSAPDEPKEMGSKKRALSYAISLAAGRILLFTDADDIVSPGWIRSMVSEFDSSTGAVLGAAIPSKSKGFGAMLYRLERTMVALTSASQIGWGKPGSACGQNIAIRKEAFEQIGGYAFAQVPSGDDDLTVQEIARAGWKVRFSGATDSVVKDTRKPSAPAHKDATARHQSVTKFYPAQWRLLYLASILSSVLLVAWAVVGIVNGFLSPVFWYLLGGKLLTDSVSLLAYSKKLNLKISLLELLTANALLPVYSMIRPLFALRSSYRWRNRVFSRSSGTLSQYTM